MVIDDEDSRAMAHEVVRVHRRQVRERKAEAEQEKLKEAFTSDKKKGHVSWRAIAEWMKQGQELKREASWSQDHAHIEMPDVKEPILVLPFSDTHMGAWSADVGLFMDMTNQILAMPNVRLLLLGDLIEMAIRLRGVAEVTNQMIPPTLQLDFIEDWLNDIGHLVMAACWDNHAVEREERGSGYSHMAALLKRRFIYHDGIGHIDVKVGSQTYKIAVSHKFRGNSYLSRTHAPKRYMRFEGSDREITIQGDIHTPGKETWYDGPNKRLAIVCGTLHTQSSYGRRHFSLYTIPAFPCFELYPDEHRFIDYWSVSDYLKAKGIELSTQSGAHDHGGTNGEGAIGVQGEGGTRQR